LTDTGRAAAYVDGTQREVQAMNDMLQHQQHFQEGIERRHREAQEWARIGQLGRLANARASMGDRRRSIRAIGVIVPTAALLGFLAILI
jgi:hypothetical protein